MKYERHGIAWGRERDVDSHGGLSCGPRGLKNLEAILRPREQRVKMGCGAWKIGYYAGSFIVVAVSGKPKIWSFGCPVSHLCLFADLRRAFARLRQFLLVCAAVLHRVKVRSTHFHATSQAHFSRVHVFTTTMTTDTENHRSINPTTLLTPDHHLIISPHPLPVT